MECDLATKLESRIKELSEPASREDLERILTDLQIFGLQRERAEVILVARLGRALPAYRPPDPLADAAGAGERPPPPPPPVSAAALPGGGTGLPGSETGPVGDPAGKGQGFALPTWPGHPFVRKW